MAHRTRPGRSFPRCSTSKINCRRSKTKKGESMNSGPDLLEPSAAELLGPDAYPESQVSYGGATYWLERSADGAKRLVAVAEDESTFRDFAGTTESNDGRVRLVADTTADNALALRSALPWLTPSRFGLHTSAGFGDRLGLATPGHVRALQDGRAPRSTPCSPSSPSGRWAAAIAPRATCSTTPPGVPSRPAGPDPSAATPITWRNSPTSTPRSRPASCSTPSIRRPRSTRRLSTPTRPPSGRRSRRWTGSGWNRTSPRS